VGIILLAWSLLTLGEPSARILGPLTLPSPWETFSSFPELWSRGLSLSILISLVRVLGGFMLSAAIGVPLGVVAGSYLRANAFFKPPVIFTRSIPVAALIPLTLMWFGIGEFNKVMFIFIATVGFVIFDAVNIVSAVPDRFIDTAYTLGAHGSRKKGVRLACYTGLIYGLLISLGWFFTLEDSNRTLLIEFSTRGAWYRISGGFLLGFALWYPIASHQVLRKVILPLALPDVVNSLRLIFGLAFGYIMLAEVINADSGIGALIIRSQTRGFTEHVYLCLFIITLLAWGIDRSIMLLQRQLFPYIKNGEN
jgi:NitT/TauT family transport system permease protein